MIGFFNVYKPTGMSSAAVVGKLKRKLGVKKIGHMGTLDPLACGILPIAVGKATRMFDYFLNKDKTYIVEAEFGYLTPSLDLGTGISETTTVIPNLDDIMGGCLSFIGKIEQYPPIYSAKSVNGVRAYDLARKGESVDLRPAEVNILRFECLRQISNTKFEFLINCSSGTYVRSLIYDLSKKLNSLATVTKLERVNSGYFDKEDSIGLDELLDCENPNLHLIDITNVFRNYDIINISDDDFYKIRNGIAIYTNLENKDNVFVKYNSELIGVGTINNNQLSLKTFLLQD